MVLVKMLSSIGVSGPGVVKRILEKVRGKFDVVAETVKRQLQGIGQLVDKYMS